MYAYCGNNPIIPKDSSGRTPETIFDLISLGLSIAEVAANPTDFWAWMGLLGDVVDVAVPFVGGLGEATRAAKLIDTVADVADTAHDVDNVLDVVDDVNDLGKSIDNVADVAVQNIHGNSLNCTRTNYGYVLLDGDDNIMKFGETLNPTKRYSKKYLSSNGVTMQILESGSKADIHYWQYDMNMYYKSKYGTYPPLNKKGW